MALSLAAMGAVFADDAAAGDKAFESQDYPTAIRLLMPLAQKGNMLAELDIGLMYFSGNRFPRDHAEAGKWFLAAAKQGNGGAQTDIGIAYATGEGVQQDCVQAYMWFSLASSQPGNEPTSKYRDHIASELAPDQIKRGQDFADACKGSNYEICGPP